MSRVLGNASAAAIESGHHARVSASATTRPDRRLPSAASCAAVLRSLSSRAVRPVATPMMAVASTGRLAASATHAAVVQGETFSGRAFPGWRLAIPAAVRP